eukprot:jgi/Bigna1/73247/fgenesh1_pg.23_\
MAHGSNDESCRNHTHPRANDESALKTPAHDPYPSWLEGDATQQHRFNTNLPRKYLTLLVVIEVEPNEQERTKRHDSSSVVFVTERRSGYDSYICQFSTAEFPLGRSKLTMSLAGACSVDARSDAATVKLKDSMIVCVVILILVLPSPPSPFSSSALTPECMIQGARRMSCGPMPNVGSNARNFLQRFIMTSDNPAAAAASTDAAPPIKTVEPDWEFNMGSSLRAFWPEAELVSANIRKPSSSSSSSSSSNSYPKFIVEYTGPTKRYKEVGQGMAMSFISTEGFLLNPDTYVIGENVEQENVEQQLVTRYRHVRSYERRKDGNILSRQRIAAFANPDTDEALYSEANGRPIAIYEYYYLLRPSADNV